MSSKLAPPVKTVPHMARRQGDQQGRNELEQTHQAQVPGARGQLVHVPGHSHHQHLVGRQTTQARQQETDIGPLGKSSDTGLIGPQTCNKRSLRIS
jgi:hypothetical protein